LENYFTDGAVKQAFGSTFSALGPYDSLKNNPKGWSKNDNWKIARAMTFGDLNGTDVGEFLESL
jgi:hypothetical protein